LKTSFLLLSGAIRNGRSAIFTKGKNPHPRLDHFTGAAEEYSDTKKYRQETLLSKVESEPLVIFQLLAV
jgi:hypothetical protein